MTYIVTLKKRYQRVQRLFSLCKILVSVTFGRQIFLVEKFLYTRYLSKPSISVTETDLVCHVNRWKVILPVTFSMYPKEYRWEYFLSPKDSNPKELTLVFGWCMYHRWTGRRYSEGTLNLLTYVPFDCTCPSSTTNDTTRISLENRNWVLRTQKTVVYTLTPSDRTIQRSNHFRF